MDLTERFTNLQLKSTTTKVFLSFMAVILVVFIVLCFVDGTDIAKWICGIMETVMSITITPLAKHFFPAVIKTIKPRTAKIP